MQQGSKLSLMDVAPYGGARRGPSTNPLAKWPGGTGPKFAPGRITMGLPWDYPTFQGSFNTFALRFLPHAPSRGLRRRDVCLKTASRPPSKPASAASLQRLEAGQVSRGGRPGPAATWCPSAALSSQKPDRAWHRPLEWFGRAHDRAHPALVCSKRFSRGSAVGATGTSTRWDQVVDGSLLR